MVPGNAITALGCCGVLHSVEACEVLDGHYPGPLSFGGRSDSLKVACDYCRLLCSIFVDIHLWCSQGLCWSREEPIRAAGSLHLCPAVPYEDVELPVTGLKFLSHLVGTSLLSSILLTCLLTETLFVTSHYSLPLTKPHFSCFVVCGDVPMIREII